MNIFVCLDEKGGMAFHKRRQSLDRMIRKDILQTIQDKTLYLTSYTAKQFMEESSSFIIEENCLEYAQADDYVWIETMPIGSYISKVQQIIVYRWKRNYPADVFWDVELPSSMWELLQSEEFEGYSHPCIGKEVYQRKETFL